MCGIVGVISRSSVNQLIYDALLLLQHRGQDAAGIVTSEGPVFHTYKGPGYVRDVFRTRILGDQVVPAQAARIVARPVEKRWIPPHNGELFA